MGNCFIFIFRELFWYWDFVDIYLMLGFCLFGLFV